MIQRIQTLYLLLVVGVLIAALCLPLGTFLDTEGMIYTFTPLHVTSGDFSHSTWGLFCLLLLSVIIAFATIFLFINRPLQLRMTIFNSILLIGYYIAFVVFVYVLKNNLEAEFRIHWALCLPIIALILNYLAIRAIGKDEILVRAADRLR